MIHDTSADMKLVYLQRHPSSFYDKSFKYKLRRLKSALTKANQELQNRQTNHAYMRRNSKNTLILDDLSKKVNEQLNIIRSNQLIENEQPPHHYFSIDEAVDTNIQQSIMMDLQVLFSRGALLTEDFETKLDQIVDNGHQISIPLTQQKIAQYHLIVKQFIIERQGGANPYELIVEFGKIDKGNQLWKIMLSQFEGITRDITEQKLAVNSLRLIQKEFQKKIPHNIEDINQHLRRNVLSQKIHLPVYRDSNNLYKYGIAYYLLKTANFDQLQRLDIDRDFLYNIIQFFKYGIVHKSTNIPKMNDIFQKQIESIMNNKEGDPKLVEDPLDLRWRSLTIYTKRNSQPIDKFPTKKTLVEYLASSYLLQHSPDGKRIEARVHAGIIYYAAQLISQNQLLELIVEYLKHISDLGIAVDYCLLLEDQQLILETLASHLTEKGKISQFFGIKNNSFTLLKGAEYERLRKYFDTNIYRTFLQKVIASNNQTSHISSSILYSKILKNFQQAIRCILEQTLMVQTSFYQIIDIIRQNKLSTFQRKLLDFVVFYRTTLLLIQNKDYPALKSKYHGYLDSPNPQFQQIFEYLFKSDLTSIYLNYLKMRILYGQKIKHKPDYASIQADFKWYVNRTKDLIKKPEVAALGDEIKNYLS